MPPVGTPPQYPPPGGPAPSWGPGTPGATGAPPPLPGPGDAVPVERWGPVDVGAMRWVLVASILGLVAFAITIALPTILGVALSSLSASGLKVFTTTVVTTLVVVVAVSGVFSVVQYFLYGRSFAALVPTDPRFRTPSRLSWLAIAGVIIAIGGIAWVLYVAGDIVSCAAGVTPVPSSCITAYTGRLVAGVAITLVGGLLGLVGLIGIWLGLWRLGTRYDAALFKVGMVLSIFPYLNLVGYILLAIAAGGVLKRARGRATPTAS